MLWPNILEWYVEVLNYSPLINFRLHGEGYYGIVSQLITFFK